MPLVVNTKLVWVKSLENTKFYLQNNTQSHCTSQLTLISRDFTQTNLSGFYGEQLLA